MFRGALAPKPATLPLDQRWSGNQPPGSRGTVRQSGKPGGQAVRRHRSGSTGHVARQPDRQPGSQAACQPGRLSACPCPVAKAAGRRRPESQTETLSYKVATEFLSELRRRKMEGAKKKEPSVWA